MNRWYVVQTKPKREDLVKGTLARAGFEVFLPKMMGGVCSYQPLFPSYVFVNSNFEDNYLYRMVHFTRGVLRVLGDREKPIPVSEDVVRTLKSGVDDREVLDLGNFYGVGDQVRLKKGVMKDVIGIVEKKIPSMGRVQVLFRWLFGNARMKVPYYQIERI